MENKLIRLIFKKEIIHWLRMKQLFKEMKDFGSKYVSYPIMVMLLSFFHYCFNAMHTAYEIYVYLRNKKQYEANMMRANSLTDKSIQQLKLNSNATRN